MNYSSTREAAELGKKNIHLLDQLSRSEEELKQAEKSMTLLKAKVKKLKQRQGHQAGSFLETPGRQEDHGGGEGDSVVFAKTPKLGALVVGDRTPDLNPSGLFSSSAATSSTVTPVMRRPEKSDVIDLGECPSQTPSVLDASVDLFEESPRTQVRKACEENKMKVVKISSAAAASNALKKRQREEEEEDVGSVGSVLPLATLNIMRRRDKAGHLFGGAAKSVIRKDYDGLGSTSSFAQPLGRPIGSGFPKKTAAPRLNFKRTKNGNLAKHPALPTLDGYIDLT